MKSINLADKLSTFTEHWQPRTVGEFNGHDLMVERCGWPSCILVAARALGGRAV